jgi:hypothetical protein
VLADFALVVVAARLPAGGSTLVRETGARVENETGLEWAPGPHCPFSILCLGKNDNYHCATDWKQIQSPILMGEEHWALLPNEIIICPALLEPQPHKSLIHLPEDLSSYCCGVRTRPEQYCLYKSEIEEHSVPPHIVIVISYSTGLEEEKVIDDMIGVMLPIMYDMIGSITPSQTLTRWCR